MSATSLLNPYSNEGTIPNPISNNSMYNPDIPVIGDLNIVRNARALKLRDRYYLDNSLDGQMKNSDGLSLGSNNKYLRTANYDRQIDINYLRRQNSKNNKHTEPNDFYNGMELGYYDLPKRIQRPVTQSAISPIDSLDAYQYKNRFIDNSMPSLPPAVIKQQPVEPITPTLPKAPVKTQAKIIAPIGFDPTDDDRFKKIQEAKERAIINRNIMSSKKEPDVLDRYGKAAIHPTHILPPKSLGIKDGKF